MSYIITLSTLILSLIISSSKKVLLPKGVSFPRTKNVFYISDNTIDELSKYYDYIFFTSYSDWCKSCLKYEENFNKIHNLIENDPDFPSIAFAKFFSTYNRKTSIKFEIRGFPTVILISNGIKVAEYLGQNSIEEIVGFLRNKLFLGAQKINNIETYEILLKNVNVNKLILMFGTKFLKPFKDVSLEYENIIFGYVDNKSLISELNADENNVVFYTNIDEGKYFLNNTELNVEKIENFIFMYNHPLVQLFSQEFADKMVSNKINFLLFINKKNDKFDFQDLKSIAKENRNNTVVSLVNYEEKIITEEKKEKNKLNKREGYGGSGLKFGGGLFGGEDKSKEIIQNLLKNYTSKKEKEIIYFDILNNQYYSIDNKNDVSKFLENYHNQKLSENDEYYKTKPLLENFRPLVLTANEKNFNNLVINNNENVFVYCFSPFSSLSKRFSSLFNNLAKKFNKIQNNIKFVEVDVTKNVIEGIDSNNYPALYFYRKTLKDKPILYEGEYNEREIFNFIKKFL
jgi:thiol-disulfide isomerase/thioredoxin